VRHRVRQSPRLRRRRRPAVAKSAEARLVRASARRARDLRCSRRRPPRRLLHQAAKSVAVGPANAVHHRPDNSGLA
jgi:hypothetical protein